MGDLRTPTWDNGGRSILLGSRRAFETWCQDHQVSPRDRRLIHACEKWDSERLMGVEAGEVIVLDHAFDYELGVIASTRVR